MKLVLYFCFRGEIEHHDYHKSDRFLDRTLGEIGKGFVDKSPLAEKTVFIPVVLDHANYRLQKKNICHNGTDLERLILDQIAVQRSLLENENMRHISQVHVEIETHGETNFPYFFSRNSRGLHTYYTGVSIQDVGEILNRLNESFPPNTPYTIHSHACHFAEKSKGKLRDALPSRPGLPCYRPLEALKEEPSMMGQLLRALDPAVNVVKISGGTGLTFVLFDYFHLNIGQKVSSLSLVDRSNLQSTERYKIPLPEEPPAQPVTTAVPSVQYNSLAHLQKISQEEIEDDNILISTAL